MAGKEKWPLKSEEAKRLADQIRQIEQRTNGEIRLMIVRRSLLPSTTGQMLFGMFMTVSLAALWVERDLFIGLTLWWVLPVLMLINGILAFTLRHLPAVIRAMTPDYILHAHTLRRAEIEFYREGLRETKGQTGILLFMSLLERKAVVLADRGIASRLDEKVWIEIVGHMINGAKSGRLEEALSLALRECGEILISHVPHSGDNKNELPDHVILKD